MTNVDGFSFRLNRVRFAKQVISLFLAGTLLLPTVTSAEEIDMEMPYIDISQHWAKAAILHGFDTGLFSTKGKLSRFEPEKMMSRGEFLVVLDRFALQVEHQLYPLSLISDHEELGWGDGFDEPYLPYTDVNRLSTMYPSVLRISLLLNRMLGPDSLSHIFPGKELHPEQAITREEVAQLLQMFALNLEPKSAWDTTKDLQWFGGEKSARLKRGEAAVIFNRLDHYFNEDPILPLLDYGGNKYPLVPDISELFPLLADFDKELTPDEQAYVDLVDAIKNREDDEKTFVQLNELLSKLPNKLGIYYYQSWNPDTPIDVNLDKAYLAIEAYFQEKQVKPKTLQLLIANVYDISLQQQDEIPSTLAKTIDRLQQYQQKTEPSSEDWQTLELYMAAMEAKLDHKEKALERYKKITGNKDALLNALYFLGASGQQEEAKMLLEQNRSIASSYLFNEFTSLDLQKEYADQLTKSIEEMKKTEGFQVNGESMLSGFLFKYTQDTDNLSKMSHSKGYIKSPEKLVLEKLEVYSDDQTENYFSYDFEEKKWEKGNDKTPYYLHEWIAKTTPSERYQDLHARYVMQSNGTVDMITEWIPADTLLKKGDSLKLEAGKLKQIPAFVTKYVIDHKSGRLLSKVWRYEELYESKMYMTYAGSESYTEYGRKNVQIPVEVKEGAVDKQ